MKPKRFLNKIWQPINRNPLLSILLLSLIMRLFYLSLSNPLWWDSHVYIGMGKYIFSGGEIGIWESFRPLLHPLILGAFWKLKFNSIIIGKILDLIFSLTAIYLTYLVGKKIFSKKVGLISALILSLTSLFIMFTGLILTEPLAITLSLLGILFFINQKNAFKIFLAGFFVALSFLTKFPQGIIFAALIFILIIKKDKLITKIKNLTSITIGFFIPIMPYLIFNYFRYQNIFEPFISGSWIVTTSTWVYGSGIFFYLIHFFLRYWIFLFFFVYVYYFFKNKHWQDSNKTTLLTIIILFLLYFTFQVPRKEIRYLVTILPFLTTVIAYTVIRIYKKLKNEQKPILKPLAFIIICTLIIIVHIPISLHFDKVPTFEEEINTVIADYNIKKPIMTSDPAFFSYSDKPIIILDAGLEFGPIIYQKNKNNYGLLFLNSCDLICPPNNQTCLNKKEQFQQLISQENKEVFTETYKNCTYYIYLPN